MARYQIVDFLLAGLKDTSGNPLSAGKVYFYDAGTLNLASVYTDLAGAVSGANPVVLDSNGQSERFVSGLFDVVVKTSADVTLYTWENVDIRGPGDGVALHGGTTGGSSTVYTATVSPSLPAYATGQLFHVNFHTACGSSPTINFNGLGAKALVNFSGDALSQNELQAGRAALVYNGTSMVVLSPFLPGVEEWSPTLTLPGGTWSTTTTHFGRYYVRGLLVRAKTYITGTTAGGPAYLSFSPPIAAANRQVSGTVTTIQNSAISGPGCISLGSTTRIDVYTRDGAAWGNAAGTGFFCDFEYEIA